MKEMKMFDAEAMSDLKVHSAKLINTDSTSKGNQTKWVEDNKIIKEDDFGYEGLAEFIASCFRQSCSNVDYVTVPYYLCHIQLANKKANGCYSLNFLKQGEELVSLHKLLQRIVGYNYCSMTFTDVCKIVSDYTHLDLIPYLFEIFAFDAMLLNRDRHLANISFIKSDSKFKFSPIFDFGAALLSDLEDFPLEKSIYGLISSVTSKPFNKDFDKQLMLLKPYHKIYKIDLSKFQDSISIAYKFYPKNYVNRAMEALEYRLNYYRGELWEEI